VQPAGNAAGGRPVDLAGVPGLASATTAVAAPIVMTMAGIVRE
jgi:hypothetical protein